jgi:hypothetical protein
LRRDEVDELGTTLYGLRKSRGSLTPRGDAFVVPGVYALILQPRNLSEDSSPILV